MRNLNNNEMACLAGIIEDKEFYVREDSTDERMILVYTTIRENDTQFTCNRANFNEAYEIAMGMR